MRGDGVDAGVDSNGLKCSGMTTIAIRRFLARPSEVELSEVGWYSP